MVTVDRGGRLGKPCGLSVPSLGRAKPPWHMPQPEPENEIWGRPYTDIWDLHHSAKNTWKRKMFRVSCCFFTSGRKSEYQNSLRIYIHHILVKHTPILKSRLTIFAFVKWLELG